MHRVETKLKNLLLNLNLETQNPKLWIHDHFDSLINQLDIFVEKKITAKYDDEHFVSGINQTRERFINEINKLKQLNLSYYEAYQDGLDNELRELIDWSTDYILTYPTRKKLPRSWGRSG